MKSDRNTLSYAPRDLDARSAARRPMAYVALVISFLPLAILGLGFVLSSHHRDPIFLLPIMFLSAVIGPALSIVTWTRHARGRIELLSIIAWISFWCIYLQCIR